MMMSAVLTMLLAAPLAAQEGYKVGPGDTIAVRVLNHDELSNVYPVAPDKSISFPLIGQVDVGGLTLAEIKDNLTRQLDKNYIRYPVVTVSLEKSGSRKFFIYGEVKTPGEYLLSKNATTVIQAITMAGGLSKSASESKVKILRSKPDDQTYVVIPVDLRRALATGQGDEALEPNDIIVIRQGWM